MTFICHTCNTEFSSSSKLYNHKYDIHVKSLQVTVKKKTSVVERIGGKFNCPDCHSKLSTSRTFNNHIQKKHRGSCSTLSRTEKRNSSETDREESASSVLTKHHKILGPQLNLDEFNSNSLTLPSLQCDTDTEVVVTFGAQDQTKSDQEKLVFSNIGNWKPIAISSECGKKYYMLASPETIEHLLADQPTGLWRPPSPNR